MGNEELKEVTEVAKKLTLLYVEDDVMARGLLKRRLDMIFGVVREASNGEEGLERFHQGGIDIIISDNVMPIMNGIDMIREIRKSDQKVPIIITTAFIDTDYLMEAINLGVTQFVAKPVSVQHLLNAIKIAIQRVVLENLTQKSKEQEIELLRFHDRYHSSQQEVARRKERNLIKNDYYLQSIKDKNGEEWIFDILYRPLEILSGDSYSARMIGDGRVVLFVIDGMGKGLSASIATTLSIAFLNHLVDEVLKSGSFCIEKLVADYMQFIQKELLEEEVISVGFYDFDFIQGNLNYITLGMPSMLIVDSSHSIMRIKSSAPPLMKYSPAPKARTLSIDTIEKVLLYSDGLNEATIDETHLYGEILSEHFLQCRFLSELDAKFKKCVESADDDITVFWVRKIPKNPSDSREFEITTSLDEVHKLSDMIEGEVESFGIDDVNATTRFATAFTEMLMNAYEHGNLGIKRLDKDRLIQDGKYDEYLATHGTSEQKIHVCLKRYEEHGANLLSCEILDEGAGFDMQGHLQSIQNEPETLTSGRGIRLTKRLVDQLCFKNGGRMSQFIVVASNKET